MLVQTLLTLLIMASLLPDAFSMRPGRFGRRGDGDRPKFCGMSDKCMKIQLKCGPLMQKMTCQEKDELDTITENCIKEAGLEEDYNNYMEDKGKYTPLPAKGFLMKLIKDDSSDINGIECCIIKEQELANEDGKVSVEKLAALFISKTDDDELKNAYEKGKEKCSDPDNCDIKAVERCLMNECQNYLTDLPE